MEKSGERCHSIEADDNLYDRLKPTTTFILPYHQYFCTILTNLLNARIAVANDCVLEIYKNEHQLVHHLENLPKIFFMEAGDLMYDFYSKLFTQVSKPTAIIIFGCFSTCDENNFRSKIQIHGTIPLY